MKVEIILKLPKDIETEIRKQREIDKIILEHVIRSHTEAMEKDESEVNNVEVYKYCGIRILKMILFLMLFPFLWLVLGLVLTWGL